MSYVRLSELLQKMTNAQRSDQMVREIKAEIRNEHLDGAYLENERFDLPKQYSKRGEEGTYQRSVREMILRDDEKLQTWFDEKNRELAASRRGGKLRATMENIEAGLLDFDEMVAATRQKMKSSFEKGQNLGNSRKSKGGSKAKAA